MSLGDYLRLQRAIHGGMDTNSLAALLGVEQVRELNEIEQRYREVGSDELLDKLAAYLNVPVDELKWHRARYRKKLSAFAQKAHDTGAQVALHLRHGETLTGRVDEWDLACIALAGPDGLTVVQRHAVVDWETVTERNDAC